MLPRAVSKRCWHLRPAHVMNRNQGLPFLDINCEQKLQVTALWCRDKKRSKRRALQSSLALTVWEVRVFWRGGVYVQLYHFRNKHFKKRSCNFYLSRVQRKITHSTNRSKACTWMLFLSVMPRQRSCHSLDYLTLAWLLHSSLILAVWLTWRNSGP